MNPKELHMDPGTADLPAPQLLCLAPGQRWLVHLSQGTWVACRTGRARLREGAGGVPDVAGLMPHHELASGQGLSLEHATWISVDAITACTLEIRSVHDPDAAPAGRRPECAAPHDRGMLHTLLARLWRLRWAEAR